MRLFTFAGSFVGGIILSSAYEAPASALVLFLAAAVALGVLLRTSRLSIRLPLVLILPFVILGMLRATGGGADSDALASYHGRTPQQVEGVVVSDPEAAGEFTRLRLRVDRIGLDGEWTAASGDVLVTLREPVELVQVRDRPYFRYGDRLLLEGVLRAPRELEDFDYRAYLARQGIGTVMGFPAVQLLDEGEGSAFYRWLYGVRHSLADSISVAIPQPQASVGQALLLGIRDNLPDGLVEDFRASGSSHMLAISGLHVGILLALSLSISQWLLGRRRHLYLLAPFALIWMYTLLSGMSPSAARAAIMFVPLLVLSVAMFLPFYLGFGSQASGILPLQDYATRPVLFFLVMGLFAFVGISFVLRQLGNLGLTRLSFRRIPRGSESTSPEDDAPAALAIGLFVLAPLALWIAAVWVWTLFTGWGGGGAAAATAEVAGRTVWVLPGLVLAALAGYSVIRLSRLGKDPASAFPLILFAAAFFLMAGAELFYVADSFGGSFRRMNTVFKVYYQAWLLLGLVFAYGVYYLFSRPASNGDSPSNGILVWAGKVGRGIWTGILVILVLASLYYPAGAVLDRTGWLGPNHTLDDNTLDGLAF
ncbi:MAG: ComEC/Rec2 family competence protein, partial [Chloroflexi bacterium]|nr:ComEC/Rec2 family competence protein [Chloroflexota bacterium]